MPSPPPFVFVQLIGVSMRVAGSSIGPSGEVVLRATPEFGSLLRGLRERRHLSLRTAGAHLGIPFPQLSRLERAQKVGPPTLDFIERAAEYYRADPASMLRAARVDLVEADGSFASDGADWARGGARPWVDPTGAEGRFPFAGRDPVEERFARLVLHPRLRPTVLTEEALEYVPARLKEAWLEFAARLVAEASSADGLRELAVLVNGSTSPPGVRR